MLVNTFQLDHYGFSVIVTCVGDAFQNFSKNIYLTKTFSFKGREATESISFRLLCVEHLPAPESHILNLSNNAQRHSLSIRQLNGASGLFNPLPGSVKLSNLQWKGH